MTDLKAQDPAGGSTKDKVADAAGSAASTVAEQGQAVAQTATSEARDVAAHAKEQVTNLTAETREQAMQALSSATSEVESQLDQRLGDAATFARSTADELRALCEGRVEDAGRTADLLKQAGHRLERFADRTDELGVRGAAEEIAEFARRRPVAFLAGAAFAGVLVGRMARAGKAVQGSTPNTPSTPSTPSPSSSLSAPTGSTGALPSSTSLGAPTPGVTVAPATVRPTPLDAPLAEGSTTPIPGTLR